MPAHDGLGPTLERVAAGEISGAVVAVGNERDVRTHAFGYRGQSARLPMEVGTILHTASMAKPAFTAAAMLLYDEGRFGLDDPVTKWTPGLAHRSVLRTPDSAIDDTVPAARDITMSDVLSHQLDIGIYRGAGIRCETRCRRPASRPASNPRQYHADGFLVVSARWRISRARRSCITQRTTCRAR